MVIPLVAVLSLPPLIWFSHHWTISHNDTARYLSCGSRLITGDALEGLNTISGFNGGHGPGLPAIVAFLILLFGRDIEVLVWILRLMALLNPLLAYFLVKRISTPFAGLLAAALVSLVAFNVKSTVAINIDATLLTFYLLSLLTLLDAIKRGGSLLALLSGVLLGIAILTKETAFVDVPLALLAVLLLGWKPRRAVWHYLGLTLVCLPWWIWVYLATGEVYLVGTLPDGMRIPILVATAILLVLATAAYASGMVDRFLAGERRRRRAGLLLVVAWTVALAGLLLSTSSYALGKSSFEGMRLYLAEVLAPAIIVVPTLLAVVGYAAWMAMRERGEWTMVSLALLFQAPVFLLLTVQQWAARQFLVPQALALCILAALVAAPVATTRWRGRNPSYRVAGASLATALSFLLLVSCVQSARSLLSESRGPVGQHGMAPQTARMADWMAENVPAGKTILFVSEPGINVAEANYLMFLDGGRHEWTRLRLDQGVCLPRPNVQGGCDTGQNDLSRTKPDALWVQGISGSCRVLSMSASNLMQQSRRTDANYVAVSGDYEFSAILGLPPALRSSGAFGLAYADVVLNGSTGMKQGTVLLEGTGRQPAAVPTMMSADTVFSLIRCESSQGTGFLRRIESRFPNGITGPNGPYRMLGSSGV
jgi:Dolichyl-phosphate-mannose-protein mannosyltransferase